MSRLVNSEGDLMSDPNLNLNEFYLTRYKYLLDQIKATDENIYKFLSLYQALATALFGAIIALFVGHGNFQIDALSARGGVLLVMSLITVVALFSVILILCG